MSEELCYLCKIDHEIRPAMCAHYDVVVYGIFRGEICLCAEHAESEKMCDSCPNLVCQLQTLRAKVKELQGRAEKLYTEIRKTNETAREAYNRLSCYENGIIPD